MAYIASVNSRVWPWPPPPSSSLLLFSHKTKEARKKKNNPWPIEITRESSNISSFFQLKIQDFHLVADHCLEGTAISFTFKAVFFSFPPFDFRLFWENNQWLAAFGKLKYHDICNTSHWLDLQDSQALEFFPSLPFSHTHVCMLTHTHERVKGCHRLTIYTRKG